MSFRRLCSDNSEDGNAQKQSKSDTQGKSISDSCNYSISSWQPDCRATLLRIFLNYAILFTRNDTKPACIHGIFG